MNWLRYIGILALLLFLQVFVLDNLHWLGPVHPFVYLWAFMMLPIELPRWLQMVIGAAIGMIMDLSPMHRVSTWQLALWWRICVRCWWKGTCRTLTE